MKMRDKILKDISKEQMMKHVCWMAEEVPQRLSGSEEDRKQTAYVKEYLESCGLEVKVHEFDAYISFPISAKLEILSPKYREIQCTVFAQINSTPPEGIEAELIYTGSGGLEEYEGKDANGKITLVELSYAPPRPEKVRIATEKGAIGQIMVNWGLPEHDSLPLGTVKAIWGNPTVDNFHLMPSIPVIGIKRRDGEYLKELCDKGPVKVRLNAQVIRKWGKIHEPVALLKGTTEPEKFVIVGGHFDAWGGGVTCNATGNAVKLELARVFAKNRDKVKRSILFAFWPGHETGIMEGSTWFVDHYWDDLVKNGIAYVNIDTQGMKGTSRYVGRSSNELIRFHNKLDQEVLANKITEHAPLAKTGDQSFFGIGIPSFYGRSAHTREEIAKWNGATIGWWYHSDFDTVDKCDPQVLLEDAMINAAYVEYFCNEAIMPMEFITVAKVIQQRLVELQEDVKGRIDLSSLLTRAREVEALSEKLDTFVSKMKAETSPLSFHDIRVQTVNNCLMGLSRALTHVISTATSKWDQDAYGLSILNYLLPPLYHLKDLGAMDPDSSEYKLLYTKLVRERNKVSDALREACDLLKESLSRLSYK